MSEKDKLFGRVLERKEIDCYVRPRQGIDRWNRLEGVRKGTIISKDKGVGGKKMLQN